MSEEQDKKYDTGEFFAAHYPNLDGSWLKAWLQDLDRAIKDFKQRFSGNVLMRVMWRGGRPEKPEWSVKIDTHKRERGKT